MYVDLVLTQHTLEEIQHAIITILASHLCSKVYIFHLAMLITMKGLHSFRYLIRSGQHKKLSNQTLFHHLRITALPPLIPRNRSLYITIDNIIYALTPPCTTNMATVASPLLIFYVHIIACLIYNIYTTWTRILLIVLIDR